MKKFNQVISVEVSVDSIATQLLNSFSKDFAHAEILTESIIGTGLTSSKLGYLYNALNGYTNDIDFKIGQIVDCRENAYTYVPTGDDGKVVVYTREYLPIGKAKIIAIDLYTNDKLRIEYNTIDSKGGVTVDTKWVDHKECSGI